MTDQKRFTNHEISILEFLLEEGEVFKTKLIPIVSSPPILSNVLRKLETDGLVTIKERRIGRKSYLVSLAPKGRLAAEKLREAQDIKTGKSIPKESITIEIPEGTYKQITKILKVEGTNVSLEDFVRDSVREKIERWKRDNPERG
ncbi:MAG: hypothetical protein M1386_04065 [Candidatus Thermoplasmatota archaeon]|jgi:DNA-binding MarR family transcriptional regulator|nr:hypothetical protein [Candidatus Thermoplasmatota archaeon]